MKKVLVVLAAIAVMAILASAVSAAPSLPITKPPVLPVPSYTGPVQDPDAIQGQWFKDVGTNAETVRSYEFHDNVDPSYGGGTDSFHAIYGKAISLTLVSGKMTAFTIQATITNDVPALSPWANGTNSHGETLETQQQYVGTLYQTKLTTSFAISGLGNLPASWTAPYRDRQPYIIAEEYDQLAWYCWTPGHGDPSGGYYVPTYDFGDIGIGESVTRNLGFAVDGAGLDPSDPRYQAIWDSRYTVIRDGGDIFLNRTTSLKISDWIDELTLDTGIPYPTDPLKGSDVSVFHAVPEPSSILALGAGLMGLLGLRIRRRR